MKFLRWRNREMSQTSRMWCLDTLSSIVGTVVGIVLTFGVTFWIEYNNKKEDNKKATMIVLENIAMIQKECNLSYDRVMSSVPVLEEIMRLTPERVEQMPEDSIIYYLSAFPPGLNVYHDFGRNLLNSNFDILRSTNNYKFLFQVHHFYTLYDQLKAIYEKSGPAKLLKDVNDILIDIAIQTNYLENSLKWNLLQIISSVKIKYHIIAYLDIFIPELERDTSVLRDAVLKVVENCGFKYEDFNDLIF